MRTGRGALPGLRMVAALLAVAAARPGAFSAWAREPPTSYFVTGYYAVWQQDWLPLDKIPWGSLTHVILHKVPLRAPGAPTDALNPYRTIQADAVSIDNVRGPLALARFAAAARARKVNALLGFGGANTQRDWHVISTDPGVFVRDVIEACKTWGYAGLDIDWEPMEEADQQLVLGLVQALRAAKPDIVITLAAGGVNSNHGLARGWGRFWAAVSRSVDQINPMSYTVTGAWPGWTVWHNNPLRGHGQVHPNSVAFTMAEYASAGTPRSRLGVGIGLYALAVGPFDGAWTPGTDYAVRTTYPYGPWVWNGGRVYRCVASGRSAASGSGPAGTLADIADGTVRWAYQGPAPKAAGDPYSGTTANADDNEYALRNVMQDLFGQGGAQDIWDEAAQASYLSWTVPFRSPKHAQAHQFVSYESEKSATAKAEWLKANGYGGVMVWTLNEGAITGHRTPVLDAMARSLLGRSGP